MAGGADGGRACREIQPAPSSGAAQGLGDDDAAADIQRVHSGDADAEQAQASSQAL